MAFDAVPPDFVFGLMASIFMVTGIINLKEGSSGFSNTGVLTVVVLYAVAEGVSQTGGKCTVPSWSEPYVMAKLMSN